MERLMRILGALTRWGLGLCALLLVLIALYVNLGRELIPLVAEYRAEVQAKAREALGMPLEIGSLEGRWSGMAPVLLAHDVTLGEGANALHLDQVQVVPDVWGSLLAREVRIDHLQLNGLKLSLKENADGQWALEGLPVQQDKPLDPAQLFNQMQKVSRLSVLDSQVTLQPLDHAPLTLTYVGLTLTTGPSRQRLDARLTLPDGQPLALSLRSRMRADQWQDAEIESYLSLPQSDWARWVPARATQQWKLSELKAGGEFWVSWAKGTLQSAAIRLNAPEFKGAYAERKPVQINNLALNAYFKRSGEGFQLSLDSLAMNLGKTRFDTRLQLQTTNTEKEGERWHLQADRLDLTPLTPIINALGPLPEGVATTIERLKVMSSLSASVPPQAALSDYLAQGGYDLHLRRLRQTLALQRDVMIDAIAESFPAGTRVTRPQGGYFLWLELAPHIDALALMRQALQAGVSLMPGQLFSADQRFAHCIRLNFAAAPAHDITRATHVLGGLVRGMGAQQQ